MSDMVSINGYKIALLTDANYDTWKMRMESILQINGLWGYAAGSIIKTAQTTDWDEKDRNALHSIRLAVSSSKLRLLKKSTTSKEAWDAIKDSCESSGPVRKVLLYKKLYSMKKDPKQTMEEYCNSFNCVADQLEEIGITIANDLLVIMLMENLPPEYSTLCTALQSQAALPAMKTFVVKLIEHESKIQNQPGETENAFMGVSKNHYRNHTNSKKKFSGSCNYCHRIGHKFADCRDRERESKAKESKPKDSSNHSHHSKSGKAKTTDAMLVIAGSAENRNESNRWCLDSGATMHMCRDPGQFTQLDSCQPVEVYCANNSSMLAKKSGTVHLEVEVEQENNRLQIEDAIYLPEFRNNLLSVPRITAKGYKVTFTKEYADIIRMDGTVAARALKENDLYILKEMEMEASPPSHAVSNHSESNQIALWHERYGHLNIPDLKKLQNKEMVRGLDGLTGSKHFECETCLLGKIHEDTYHDSDYRADRNLALVHSDLCGPFKTASLGGAKYFMTFLDDHSRYAEIKLLRTKDAALEAFKGYKAMAEKSTGRKILKLRTDNGSEYVNEAFDKFLLEQGIKRDKSCPYTPQQNGRAERLNRTLVEMGRCLLIQGNLPESLWGEALNTAVYLRNRCPTAATGFQTPYELWVGQKPGVAHFKKFGCRAVFLRKGPQRGSKWQPKGALGVMVGYDSSAKGFRIWEPGTTKVHITRDVKFLEQETYREERHTETKNKQPETTQLPLMFFGNRNNNATQNGNRIENENVELETPSDNERNQGNVAHEETLRIVKKKKKSKKTVTVTPIDHDHGYHLVKNVPEPTRRSERIKNRKDAEVEIAVQGKDEPGSNKGEIKAPKTVKQALSSPKANEWRSAMNEELEMLRTHDAWDLVPRPENANVIGSRWVYAVKHQEDGSPKYKARLVAQGFKQRPGVDYEDTYAPVIRKNSIRALMAIAVEMDLEVHHMDVKSAYLHSHLKEETYMEQPPSAEEADTKAFVCKLKKSIYGLAQAGKDWNEHASRVLLANGFTRSEHDPCVFYSARIIIGLYVDDKLIIGKSYDLPSVKSMLQKHLDIKDLGPAKRFLAIEVERDDDGTLMLSQTSYIEKMLKEFGMEKCNGVTSPIQLGKPTEELKPDEKYTPEAYRKGTGSLQYLASATRPDISFVSSYLSRFNDSNELEHWVKLKHVFRYLKATKEQKLIYRKTGKPVEIFSDADWASDITDRRSWSGMIVLLAGGAISWHARKQHTVATSTQESECIAAGEATREILWLNGFINELKFFDLIEKPTILYMDNVGAMLLGTNNMQTEKSKHIDVRHHFIRQHVEEGTLKLEYVKSKENLADIMTKGLPGPTFRDLRGRIGLE